MPIYELKCLSCDIVFEFLKIRDSDKPECPKCNEKRKSKFEKQVSRGTSFDLKGKGWYKDGY